MRCAPNSGLTGIDVLLVSPNTTRSEFFDSLLEQQGGGSRQSLEHVTGSCGTADRPGHPAAVASS